jgi:uncharacterized protein (DUF885 family)
MAMNNKNEELQNYLKDYWEHRLKYNPTFATYIGDHRYDDALEDLSEESITAQAGYYRELLSKTEKIDTDLLTPENKLNCHIFKNTLQNYILMYQYKTHYLPIDQMSGPHIDFPQLIEFHPFTTRKDFENYIARLNAFPHLIEQVIENLQKGTEQKITAFKKNMELAIVQVETLQHFPLKITPCSALS